MRVLLAISIFALIALLWAAASMARHIRRVRRRRQRTEDVMDRQSLIPSQSDVSELTFGEDAGMTAIAISEDTAANSSEPAAVAASEFDHATEVHIVARQPETVAVAATVPEPESAPLSTTSDSATVLSEPEASETIPPAENEPFAFMASSTPQSAIHPITAQGRPVQRADWSYFNKDMGDLTDPYETPRLRPAGVSHSSGEIPARRKDTA